MRGLKRLPRHLTVLGHTTSLGGWTWTDHRDVWIDPHLVAVVMEKAIDPPSLGPACTVTFTGVEGNVTVRATASAFIEWLDTVR